MINQPENPANMGPCNNTKKPNPKFLDKPLDWFVNKHCQLAFTCEAGEHTEYMWVKVSKLAETDGEELQGILDNDPVVAVQFSCGDLFEFSRKEIINVYE